MKIRNGFVSNSSSSSFIVTMTDFYEEKKLLSQKEINKLLKYGFKYCDVHYPIQLEEAPYDNKPYTDKINEFSDLGYNVDCNEDEVIKFLLKNNISFQAVKHYGHESVFFEKNSDKILFVKNTGLQFEMYGDKDSTIEESIKEFKESWRSEDDIFKIVTVKEYLKSC